MMPTVDDLLALLPPPKMSKDLIVEIQDEVDMMQSVVDAHKKFAYQYDMIYRQFDTGRVDSTGKLIWEFLKYNLVYTAEGKRDQTKKSAVRILCPGEKIDCKHYSSFAGGVLDAIKRNEGDKFTWCYRYGGYDSSGIIGHVFVVINPNTNNEIWLDPVLGRYNERLWPNIYEDKFVKMALYELAGIGKVNNGKRARNSVPDSQPVPASSGVPFGVVVAGLVVMVAFFHRRRK
jgi:hypothetical protein